jgi:hypothetical protein
MEDKIKKTKAEKVAIHEFTEEERTLFAVTESEDKPPMLGISGFGMSIIYDEQQLQTMEQLEEAAHALANQLIQFVLEKTMGGGEEDV